LHTKVKVTIKNGVAIITDLVAMTTLDIYISYVILYYLLLLFFFSIHEKPTVSRYLRWLGIKTQIFSVGNYRRKLAGLNLPHSFFDTQNAEALHIRHEAASHALADMIKWFTVENGTVAIFDATNSTTKSRAWIYNELTKNDIETLFIESICDDEDMILSNINDVTESSPDYDPTVDVGPPEVLKRIRHYESAYETISEENYTYIKLINAGSQYIINMIRGYLESRIVYYLMNLHTRPKTIWFSRVSKKKKKRKEKREPYKKNTWF
jgi:6-phosphofructo-2-kinase/fructose-2,6-biphosphatase 2